MIVGEGWLSGLESLDLRVVELEGYRRGMRWEATGLPWVPPSPNVPDVETARVYPGTALFEGTTASEGRGTLVPFTHVGSPWVDADALACHPPSCRPARGRVRPRDVRPRRPARSGDEPEVGGRDRLGRRLGGHRS